MSKVSIYETGWLNLVFDGRNKEYGAYQLRQENPKTTIFALFAGFMLLATVVSIPMAINYFSVNKMVIEETPEIEKIVQVTDLFPPLPQLPEKQFLPITKEPEAEIDEKVPLKDPVIVKPIDANESIAKNTDPIPVKTNPNPNTGTSGTAIAAGTGPSTTTTTTIPVDYGNTIIPAAALDKLPEFPGGLTKFREFVGTNFEKPDSEEGKNVTVNVYFVVEKDGSLTDIQVRKDPGYGLGKEAVRVLKSLRTKWKPGIIAGKPVRTSYTLPITVRL